MPNTDAENPHLAETAILLAEAEEQATRKRALTLLEALIHAVLHLAQVIDIRETIAREQ